jgi:hypothetical protein
MATRIVVGLGLLGLLVGVAVAGAQERNHQIATNGVARASFVAVVEPGRSACQDGETVPAGTGAVELRIGTYGRPGEAFDVDVRDGAQLLLLGRRDPGWPQGDVVVETAPARARAFGGTLCVRNRGTHRIAVAGDGAGMGATARVGSRPALGRMAVSYLEPARESWWSRLGILSDRVEVVRGAPPGAATFAGWGLLVAGMIGLGALVALRAGRR